MKHSRHWSLMRTLCCPILPPDNASSRFPGGAFRSPSRTAASSIRSFRRATFTTSEGNPFGISPANTAAVFLSRKLSITRYASHNTCIRVNPAHPSGGYTTPVSPSDIAHSRAQSSRTIACLATTARFGAPLISSTPSGPQ